MTPAETDQYLTRKKFPLFNLLLKIKHAGKPRQIRRRAASHVKGDVKESNRKSNARKSKPQARPAHSVMGYPLPGGRLLRHGKNAPKYARPCSFPGAVPNCRNSQTWPRSARREAATSHLLLVDRK
jgi:hypothetical protein